MRLGFGADDKVKIERTVVKRNEGSAGLIVTTSKTDERAFKTTVRNGHDFPIRIAIEDQLPVSENEEIQVEMLPSTTPPTATNLRDKRGVLEWAFEAKAGEVSDIDFAWRVRWPKDKGVVLMTAGPGSWACAGHDVVEPNVGRRRVGRRGAGHAPAALPSLPTSSLISASAPEGRLNRPANREKPPMPYEHILVDDPRAACPAHHAQPPGKAQCAEQSPAGGSVRGAGAGRSRSGCLDLDLRGAGPCFSAGYDLSADNRVDQPYHSAAGPGQWSRHVVEGWFGIWDLAKPVVAQVHGIASPAELNWRPPAISSTSPTTPRSAIRRCG